ncbi:hypothetical protein EZV62_022225 [Acer yangbiense]|uniref:CCHC-type domain-containing protein n=1 Tax=Acer yangbiense TaxID=1000413 RepID=A0A5C7HA35_9ROSI|nr:hypothetical protein EZV62_022225 [Acer yangbiense]
MDAQEIVRLCESLSLVEDVGAIRHVEEDHQMEGLKDVSHVLVGKVLTGRKVNREAFIGLIEQLWSPIGRVDTESVGENIFMFYFENTEDRNRIWQRGPWHFDNSLITLEKPDRLGDISMLKFNQADFWVQIHNIPIMCMNRSMARWLANQLEEVLELPSDSKECWGKFLRVKVRIDISRPLERWLRLRLDNSGKVVVVVLKYERLPEFCYACGKIGHALRDCHDDEARMNAMEGSIASFGAWMRATAPDRTKTRNSQSEKGESSGEGKNGKRIGWNNFQTLAAVRSPSPLGQGNSCGCPTWELMNVDGPEQEGKSEVGPRDKDIEMEGVGSPSKKTEVSEGNSPQKLKSRKKWKRAARGVKGQQIPVKLSSPLNKMLALSQKSRSNTSLSKTNRQPSEMDGVKCKRKVEFSTEEEITERKKTQRKLPTNMLPTASNSFPDWIPPPPGQLKLNCGVARRKDSGVVGIGVAIRNDKGKVLVSLSKALLGNFSLVTSTALALREGLLLAKAYNLNVMIAEVESPTVASSLFSSITPYGEASVIFKDINFLSIEVGICKGQTISRSGNTLAFNLASLASSSCRYSLWLDFSPSL